MLPLKDIATPDARPALAYGVVVACVVVALATGAGLLVAALLGYAAWLFAPPLETTLGRVPLVLVAVAGALAGQLLGAPAAGVAGAVALAYVVTRPRGRILTASFVPGFFTLVEVPGVVLAAAFAAGLALLGPAGG